MNILLVCGPPGAGKSRYIARELSTYPLIDMSEMRTLAIAEFPGATSRVQYRQSMYNLYDELALTTGAYVVVEGIFAPGSHSRRWLMNDYDGFIAISTIIRPFMECVVSIMDDYRTGAISAQKTEMRLKLLAKYHDKFKEGND